MYDDTIKKEIPEAGYMCRRSAGGAVREISMTEMLIFLLEDQWKRGIAICEQRRGEERSSNHAICECRSLTGLRLLALSFSIINLFAIVGALVVKEDDSAWNQVNSANH